MSKTWSSFTLPFADETNVRRVQNVRRASMQGQKQMRHRSARTMPLFLTLVCYEKFERMKLHSFVLFYLNMIIL